MQIILQEDIEKLGHRGDVVTVKPGYARNFLLPRKLAVEASAGNLKAIEKIRASLAKKTATEMEAAQKQAAALNGVELSFTRKTGENDQLGSRRLFLTSSNTATSFTAWVFSFSRCSLSTARRLSLILLPSSARHLTRIWSPSFNSSRTSRMRFSAISLMCSRPSVPGRFPRRRRNPPGAPPCRDTSCRFRRWR